MAGMAHSWFEVWADDGLSPPYVLLVFPSGDGRIVVFDPKESKAIHTAADYESAKLWLLEDEYTRVEGRMVADSL